MVIGGSGGIVIGVPALSFAQRGDHVLMNATKVCALLRRQRPPRRHIGSHKAASDRVEKIIIGRQRAGRRRSTLKGSLGEIARFRINPLRVHSFTVAPRTMATYAEPDVEMLARLGVSGQVADVTCFRFDRRRAQISSGWIDVRLREGRIAPAPRSPADPRAIATNSFLIVIVVLTPRSRSQIR